MFEILSTSYLPW